jgi:hypothetical protein
MKPSTSRHRPVADSTTRRCRRLSVSVFAAATAQIAVLGQASPAQAYCNGFTQPRNYAGQVSAGGLLYNGLERYISVPNSKLDLTGTSQEFISHWIDLFKSDPSLCTAPGASGRCWTQVGHTIGMQTDGVHTNYNVYAEASQAGGTPVFHDYTEYPTSVGSNRFYSVYNNTPPDGFGLYHFTTNYGGTHDLSVVGFMPWPKGAAEAESEMYNGVSGSAACPTIGQNDTYVYFGTNGSGGASASTELFNSSAVPNNWSAWTGAVVARQNYKHVVIVSNSAFKNRGGNE